MIWRTRSTHGVDINDISDWGENLGSIYHSGALPSTIRNQQEVLLEEGYYRKISNPQPILENGNPKIDFDADGNEIYWMEVELEELRTPIREISN